MDAPLSAMLRVGLFAALAASSACSSTLTYTPHGTSRAPEADAHITADVNHDQANTHLQLQISHLAPPDRIQQGATTFVVWERRDQSAQWTRVGALVYNASDRSASLDATAPDTGFELSVTVESDASPGSPSPNVVLVQRVGNAQSSGGQSSSGSSSSAPEG